MSLTQEALDSALREALNVDAAPGSRTPDADVESALELAGLAKESAVETVEETVETQAQEPAVEETEVTSKLMEENEYLKRKLGEQSGDVGSLRKELAQLRDTVGAQPQQTQAPMDEDSMITNAVKGLYGSGADPKDELYRINATGHIRAWNIMQTVIEKALAERDTKYAKLEQRFDELDARASSEVRMDPKVEQELLREYPEFAGLQAKQRVSVLQRMAKTRAGNGNTDAKPVSKAAPQRKAEEYVEGSAASASQPSSQAALEEKFDKLNTKQQSRFLSELLARTGPGVLYRSGR